MDIDLRDLISLEEAARRSDRSPTTLRQAAQRGTLDARRIGRDWVTTSDAVAEYMAFHARWRRPRRR